MGWIMPRTWVSAELVTVSHMNTHVRDNLLQTAPAKVTTAGDLLYATGANALVRLGIGGPHQVLRTNSGATAPEWVSGAIAILTAQGDILYASGANVLARLGIGAAGKVLGRAGNVPAWITDPALDLFQAQGDILYATGADAGARLAKGTTAQYLKGGNTPSWATPALGEISGDLPDLGFVQFARKSADEEVVSSTALQPDNHLALTVGANQEWVFIGHITINPVGGGGFKCQFSGPSGATGNWSVGALDVSTEPLAGRMTLNNPMGWTTVERPGIAYSNVISGFISVAATPGTLQFEFAQEVSNGAGVTVEEGSWLLGFRVG